MTSRCLRTPPNAGREAAAPAHHESLCLRFFSSLLVSYLPKGATVSLAPALWTLVRFSAPSVGVRRSVTFQIH